MKGDWGRADPMHDDWDNECGRVDIQIDDPINSPRHYTAGPIECIDAIVSAAAGWPAWAAPLLANVIKYTWRAFRKGKAGHDLAKADWYLSKVRDELQRRGYTEE